MIKKCNWCDREFEITEQEKMYCSLEHRNIAKEYMSLYRKTHNIDRTKYFKKYRIEHKEKLKKYIENYQMEHKQALAEKQKNNLEYLEYQKQYRLGHLEKAKKYNKKYGKDHKEELNLYIRNKKELNISFKILCNLRSRIWDALKRNAKSAHTMNLIGCSIEDLKSHLENQFTIGMSWKNYGKWHVDHIRPCASFDMANPEHQKICFNYKNLQPLWAHDNLVKKDKI